MRLAESAIKRAKANIGVDTYDESSSIPSGGLKADRNELRHNNTYGSLPFFYMDKLVICQECSKEEVWTARKQKWWYEEAKGNINTEAIFCKNCRAKKKSHKEIVRERHLEGVKRKSESKT